MDESNYSPSLCGDCIVCALATIGERIEGIKDCKVLTPKRRAILFQEIQKNCLYYAIPVTPVQIGKIGVYIARNMGIATAINGLIGTMLQMRVERPEKIILDGYWSKEWIEFFSINIAIPIEGIIGADKKIYEVSAASIVAKMYCDSLLAGWDKLYPKWGIGCDHGAITKDHLEELKARGPSPVHRVGMYAKDWWKRILG
ncbi:MAG: hypothetical protein ABIC57_03875 [bacterium]